jgi:hypothetical protein
VAVIPEARIMRRRSEVVCKRKRDEGEEFGREEMKVASDVISVYSRINNNINVYGT